MKILASLSRFCVSKTRLLVYQRSETDDHDLALEKICDRAENPQEWVQSSGHKSPTLLLTGRVDGFTGAAVV